MLPNLFDLAFLRGACLSPDGRHVAYGVSRTDDQERFEVIVADLGGGVSCRLDFPGNASAPCWSPDGSSISFSGDERLHLAAFPSLRISAPLTPPHLAVRGLPSWSPDGSRLAVTLLERLAVGSVRRIAGKVFRADGLGFLDELHQGLYEVDVRTRDLKCLARAGRYCSQPEWSSCGRRILFLACDEAIPFATYSQRLLTLDIASGAIETALGEGWYVECARWMPDGERIAISGAPLGKLPVPIASLWVVNRRGGQADLRTPRLCGNIGLRINHDMPARELTGRNPFVVTDERNAYATVQRGGHGEIWRIALQGDIASEKVLGGDEQSHFVLDVHRQSSRMLFATTGLLRPPDLHVATLGGAQQVCLTQLNAGMLARWPEMQIAPFRVQSSDGLTIDAWFLSRVDRQPPLPTVLFIHAGPFAATGQAFRYDFHLLAAHGFGVVFANFRGSAGYGEAFAEAIVSDWGGRGFPDHMATIDEAIARGYADPDRIGVWGPSHGGFATCWIVGHTRRFKAAVAEAAITDFASLYYTTDAPAVFARDLGGTPREILEVYRRRSPLTYAHQCSTPTLLIHGEEDLRCPIAQAEAFHRALLEAGCITELVRIPYCSHSGDSLGPLSVRAAQNEVLLGWFQRYL